jgi:heptosyltransferase-3
MNYGPADAIDVSGLRRALVIQLRHHGDVLLSSPVFTVLNNRAPGIEIDALVYSETREMLDHHPSISRVHVVERKWKELSAPSRFAAEWRLYHMLRGRAYDLVIHLTDHPRGAWLARALGARYAVAPNAEHKSHAWKRSFTHLAPLPAHGGRHRVELNLDVLRRIGIQPGEQERELVLVPGRDAEREVGILLSAQGLVAKRFIHFHPGSRWQFKCWPPERAGSLIGALEKRGVRVVLTAAPDEREMALVAEIRKHATAPFADLAGKLTLKQLAALSANARLFIGVDSAPMHIAAAMRTPVVALFGPSSEIEWGPWRAPSRIVASAQHACRPCGNDGCGGGKVSECITRLPVDSILEAADSLLSR